MKELNILHKKTFLSICHIFKRDFSIEYLSFPSSRTEKHVSNRHMICVREKELEREKDKRMEDLKYM